MCRNVEKMSFFTEIECNLHMRFSAISKQIKLES